MVMGEMNCTDFRYQKKIIWTAEHVEKGFLKGVVALEGVVEAAEKKLNYKRT